MRNIILAIVGFLLVVLLIFVVWWIVDPPGESPEAVDYQATTAYETAVSGSVKPNESELVPSLLFIQNTAPQQTEKGSVTMDSAGTYVYTPTSGFHGLDQFDYELCNSDGGCATGTVTVTVNPPVVVANDDTVVTMVNTAVTIGVTANDQGENLVVQTPGVGTMNGTAVIQADPLLITYTPNENFVGNDSFSYSVCVLPTICDSAQVNITVRDFEVTNDQFTTPKNQILTANVRQNDSGELSVTTSPQQAPTNGTLTLQASGEFSYTPNTDFAGEDTFQYEACNESAMCATAMVSIKVGGPLVEDYHAATLVNRPISENALKNSSGDNLQINTNPVVAPANGGIFMSPDGEFTYTPNTDFVGSDALTFEVCDSDGLCANINITLKIDPIPASAIHIVKPGEWLLQIARCYGTTVRDIRAHNYIYNQNYITPGQKLNIYNIGSVGEYHGPDPECVERHEIVAGDTLESIAAMHNISESELARINGLYTTYYVYHEYPYYVYSYRHCCGYDYYPTYGYYTSYQYRKDIYVGQMLILPKPVPDYMKPSP